MDDAVFFAFIDGVWHRAAAVASGAAHFDDGSLLVFAHLGPLNDDAELDKMVTGVVGAQFLHSGHHLSDSALAIETRRSLESKSVGCLSLHSTFRASPSEHVVQCSRR